MRRILFLAVLFLFGFLCLMKGQQNGTLFFMLSTPQANFVNPAVRNDCKWMLGLPVLSSVHLEFGNSAFSVMQILQKQPDQTYLFDGNTVLKQLGHTNYLTTEIHTNLFFLSFWRGENFYTISVNEKADLFATYPKDLFALAWNGNTQFVDKTADLSRTGVSLNYRREYAFGIAKQPSTDMVWGIRGKLLFGKLNTSFKKSTLTFFTAKNTYDLTMNADWQINTSLPMAISINPDNTINSVSMNGTLGGVLMNRSNIGLAVDLGFIQKIDDHFTLSGSLLDLGLIRWVSNGYSFAQKGNYTFIGPSDTSTYFKALMNAIKTDLGIHVVQNSYISYLIPTYYLGVTYTITNSFNLGLVSSGRISRYRITSGLTLSANKTFDERASISISYSYLYRSFSNLGAGIKLGKSPLQFYAVSDNIIGLIKPLETKNINIRFGLQFNFGCFQKEKVDGCGCAWMKKSSQGEERKQRSLKKKKKI